MRLYRCPCVFMVDHRVVLGTPRRVCRITTVISPEHFLRGFRSFLFTNRFSRPGNVIGPVCMSLPYTLQDKHVVFLLYIFATAHAQMRLNRS